MTDLELATAKIDVFRRALEQIRDLSIRGTGKGGGCYPGASGIADDALIAAARMERRERSYRSREGGSEGR